MRAIELTYTLTVHNDGPSLAVRCPACGHAAGRGDAPVCHRQPGELQSGVVVVTCALGSLPAGR